MIRTADIKIQWRVVGEACLRLGLAFGAAFLVLALLRHGIPGYEPLAQNSPWIPKYIGDSIAGVVGLITIWRISQGRLGEYGFTLANRNLRLKLSAALGVVLGLIGGLLDHLPQAMAGDPIEPAYPLTLANVLGMLSFQWVFVGLFEETVTRGLVQTHLMNRLKGTITLFRWDLHIGSVITAHIRIGAFWPPRVLRRLLAFLNPASRFRHSVRPLLELYLSRDEKPGRSYSDAQRGRWTIDQY